MRRTWLAGLILVVAVTPASARHHHRHHHGHAYSFFGFMVGPTQDHARTHRSERARPFIPANWQLEPPDPKWNGKRFVSPDGQAWFAAYSSDVGKEPVETHMQAVSFAKGETLTSIQGQSDRIAVSGTKGDRVFYRKAVIACGGRTWHHVAFEYPVAMRRYVEPMVRRAAAAVEATDDDGCQAPNDTNPPAEAKRAPAATTGSTRSP